SRRCFEAARLYHAPCAFTAGTGENSHTVTKANACNRAANSIHTTGAVTVPGTRQESGGTGAGNIRRLIGIAISGQAVGITKSASLNLLERFVYRRQRCTASREGAGLDRLARAGRLGGRRFKLRFGGDFVQQRDINGLDQCGLRFGRNQRPWRNQLRDALRLERFLNWRRCPNKLRTNYRLFRRQRHFRLRHYYGNGLVSILVDQFVRKERGNDDEQSCQDDLQDSAGQ